MSQLSKNIYLLLPTSIDQTNGKMLFNNGKQVVIVMHQASWCGHCTRAKPAFQKAADILSDVVTFATIDHSGQRGGASAESDIVANLAGRFYGIQGFPTFSLFINGDRIDDFDVGDRSVDAIVNALKGVMA